MTAADIAITLRVLRGANSREELFRLFNEAATSDDHVALKLLPGPWHDATVDARFKTLIEKLKSDMQGRDVFLYAQWQQQFGDAGLSSNIVVPSLQSVGMGSK